ncbi:hypothetical protein KR059_009095, partial [Drosophila kikkawai]
RLASSFQSLTEEDEFTDCCICVESRTFRCHKVILGVAADFFKRTFLSGFKESTTGQLVLTNVKADTFEKFRLYAYTYNRETLNSYSNEDIVGLLECAAMWMVDPLNRDCVEIIKKRLPEMLFSDLLLYFEFGHHIHEEYLIGAAAKQLNLRYIRDRRLPDEVFQLGSDVFREFLTAMTHMKQINRYQCVEKYVAIHGFVLNLDDAKKWEFKGLANNNNNKQESDDYANPNPFKVEKLNLSANADSLAISLDPRPKEINIEYVKSLLNLIDFKKMTAQEFYDGPGKSKMMTFEEKFNLLYTIVK